MATRVKISTRGFEELLERIAEIGQDVDASAQRALAAGAEVARAGMVRRVPKDTHNLERHIKTTEVTQDGNYHYVEIGVIGADADTARYGNAQEYGTSSMAAQPYIRPTMAEDTGKIRRAMRESLEQDGKL